MPLVESSQGIFKFEKLFKNDSSLIHGFSSRYFGDVKLTTRNSPKESFNRFLGSLGIDPQEIVLCHQVHGNVVSQVSQKNRGQRMARADALVTQQSGIFLTVTVADCLPILFYDAKGQRVGLAHAGWRGTAQAVAAAVVNRFKELGSNPDDILVGIGPGICLEDYQVGREVIKEFSRNNNQSAVFVGDKLNLLATNLNQLWSSGVRRENVESANICTFEDSRFYSWRREKPNLSGEFAAVIGLRKRK